MVDHPRHCRGPLGRYVYVTGESVSAGTWQKFVTVAYDALTGAQVWEARYSGPTIWSEVATGVTTSPDGTKVYVTGYGQNPGTSLDYTTIAYDAATGTELWVTHYAGSGGGWDQAEDILVSPDGGTVYVTGYSELGTGWIFEAATIAMDAETGALLWTARYAGPGGQAYGLDFELGPDGEHLFVTGMRQGPNDWDYVTIKYDAETGQELWATGYDGPAGGFDIARGIAISHDGARVFVGGESTGIGTETDLAAIAYDAQTGDGLWTQRYDGPLNHIEYSHGIVVTPDDRTAILAGSSLTANSLDYVVIGYDVETGEESWFYTYDGPGADYDEVRGMTLSASGDRVYVTGQSWGPTAYDMTTTAVDTSNGEEVWVSRYDNVGSRDYGAAMAFDPIGLRVYGTGYSRSDIGELDYVTIGYLLDETALATSALGHLPD